MFRFEQCNVKEGKKKKKHNWKDLLCIGEEQTHQHIQSFMSQNLEKSIDNWVDKFLYHYATKKSLTQCHLGSLEIKKKIMWKNTNYDS